MASDKALAIAQGLAPHEVKALNLLVRHCLGSYERLSAIPGLGQTMIDRFIAAGLAEQGVVNSYTGAIGYRETKLGRDVFDMLGKRKPKQKPKLTMLKPKVRTVQPLLKPHRNDR